MPIIFKGVCLTLGKKKILRDLSFCLKNASKVAILGNVNSGKHYIIELLLGTLSVDDAEESSIKIFGQRIEKLNPMEIRKSTTFLQKNPCVFSGTIRDNIDPNSEFSDRQILHCFHFFDALNILTNGKKQKLMNSYSRPDFGRQDSIDDLEDEDEAINIESKLNKAENAVNDKQLFYEIYNEISEDIMCDRYIKKAIKELNLANQLEILASTTQNHLQSGSKRGRASSPKNGKMKLSNPLKTKNGLPGNSGILKKAKQVSSSAGKRRTSSSRRGGSINRLSIKVTENQLDRKRKSIIGDINQFFKAGQQQRGSAVGGVMMTEQKTTKETEISMIKRTSGIGLALHSPAIKEEEEMSVDELEGEGDNLETEIYRKLLQVEISGKNDKVPIKLRKVISAVRMLLNRSNLVIIEQSALEFNDGRTKQHIERVLEQLASSTVLYFSQTNTQILSFKE